MLDDSVNRKTKKDVGGAMFTATRTRMIETILFRNSIEYVHLVCVVIHLRDFKMRI